MTSPTFCSQKFEFIQINLHDGVTQSCCSLAQEDRPKLNDVKESDFFNYPAIVSDRSLMLQGQQPAGCNGCWVPESRGLLSLRQWSGYHKCSSTPGSTGLVPKHVNLVLGNKCLLTCAYCCKKFSHRWLADIVTNGGYNVSEKNIDRVTPTPRDRVLLTNKHRQTFFSQLALENIDNWISTSANPIKFNLSGGEPFLFPDLCDVLARLANQDVTINSGLGLPPPAFDAVCKSIASQKFANLHIEVSAETIGRVYEFVRHGIAFDNFMRNLEILDRYAIPYSFNGVISNLTIFGISDFIQEFSHVPIKWMVLRDPDYLKINVLDPTSKERYRELSGLAPGFDSTLDQLCTDDQKSDARAFISEYAKRRNLSIDVFPNHFTEWLFRP